MKFNLGRERILSFYRILLVMKLTTILLICAFLKVSATGFAQHITLSTTNGTLESVLKKISEQSNHDFLYSATMLKDAKKVTINVKNATLEEALLLCFRDQPFTYSLTSNTVIVKNKDNTKVTIQTRTVSGIVRGTDGVALPGVSVRLKGTTKSGVTNERGQYVLEINGDNNVLSFSFLGYATQEVSVGNRTTVDAILVEREEIMDNVVVTALGIQRQKRSLGYAVSDISGDEVTGFGEPNAISALQGKVAGVNISNTTAGATGSSRVVIRGIRELQGSNQPLYVIDGVPAVNGNIGSADQHGGFDLGDGLADLNPNDIESVSVLKGASAAVLYGSRALNGVILITTKSGKGKKGLGIEYNSSLTTDNISTRLDERQKVYGQGTNGLLPKDATQAGNITANWGPRYSDFNTIIQRDGQERPYDYLENNVQNFFRTGVTGMNTVSLTGGNENHNLRFSYSNVANKDIIPTSGYDRNNFSFRGESKIAERLTLEVKGSLMNEKVRNRPALTDDVNNIGNGLIGLAGNFDQAWLQHFENEDGTYINYTGNQYRANPYWTINRTRNDSKKVRTGGSANLIYQIDDNWSAVASAGTDFYNFEFTNFYDLHTPTRTGGQLQLNDLKVREDNFQAMVNFNKEINAAFTIGAMLGGNIMKFNREQTITMGNEIISPGKMLITNFRELLIQPLHPRKEIQSVFGNVEIGYNNYLFLNLQGRNDWSSTLPKGSNAYFYPAADLSFVLSDAFDLQSNVLNYAKLRTSYGQVGSDADPYKTDFLYNLTGQSMNGFPMGEILGDVIPNANLKPQRKNSFEVGTDLSFLKNRIHLDVTYYNEVTNDVLLDVPVPSPTGYARASLNAAKLKNKGVEILLKTTPVSLENSFKWDLSFNFAKNYNTVVDLSDNLEAYTVAEARWAGATIIAEKGKPFGTILGRDFQKDDTGNIIHGSDGKPLYTDGPVAIGNSLPNWTGGLTNSFSYRGVEFRATVDIRKGGSLFSMTNMMMYDNGSHLATSEGRDSWNEYYQERRAAEDAGLDPDAVDRNGRGFIGVGVNENGEPNDVAINPAEYWRHVSEHIPASFIYDGGYIKLRDVGISYTLPQSMVKRMPIQSVSIGVIGRNLWIMRKNVPNIDPESNYNNGNGQGFEYGSLPGRRSIGFNLNVRF
ncbi:SusC/RagA family TonB-linked outer membrane protein [Sphingobacterium phlebotomi]|uniref:SusC/RagA family TonB-linked outer membrane protein n=1 Tax=Sphingobacterium phlebotomi TaxID=2605433 RepID=A0A5D4H1S7_9SPHI|nr:SusC/RagA family TonB-linked outer membrane protein [Sphingobacterium phlebotomi]TYR34507.1 SusC/RagA family TonB-linked outer membrane protein [Sphingobacterium phlebotomi]